MSQILSGNHCRYPPAVSGLAGKNDGDRPRHKPKGQCEEMMTSPSEKAELKAKFEVSNITNIPILVVIYIQF